MFCLLFYADAMTLVLNYVVFANVALYAPPSVFVSYVCRFLFLLLLRIRVNRKNHVTLYFYASDVNKVRVSLSLSLSVRAKTISRCASINTP